MKKFLVLFISLLMTFSLIACNMTSDSDSTEKNKDSIIATPGAEANATTPPIDENSANKIEFTNDSITTNDNSIEVNGTTATIKNEGTYEISGECSNGQIIVDALDANIYFIFNGISLNCNNSAPLNIINANNVYISLSDGSTNTISDSGTYNLETGITEPDATIFSKGDLNISGKGTLNVNSVYNDAIASRDKLVIESGIININAKNHGIKGKDLLSVIGGEINVIAGADGIKSTNDIDSAKGYVSISGGKINIDAQDEAISAVTYVNISGGEVIIKTANNGIKANSVVDISAGIVNIETDDKHIICAERKISSNADVKVNGEKLQSNY